MRQEGKYKLAIPVGNRIMGGLRLLVQKWRRDRPGKDAKQRHKGLRQSHRDLKQNCKTHKLTDWACSHITEGSEGKSHRLPFSSPETLDLIMKTFHLPQSYPHDLTGHYSVPIRLQWIEYGIDTAEPGVNLGSSTSLCM